VDSAIRECHVFRNDDLRAAAETFVDAKLFVDFAVFRQQGLPRLYCIRGTATVRSVNEVFRAYIGQIPTRKWSFFYQQSGSTSTRGSGSFGESHRRVASTKSGRLFACSDLEGIVGEATFALRARAHQGRHGTRPSSLKLLPISSPSAGSFCDMPSQLRAKSKKSPASTSKVALREHIGQIRHHKKINDVSQQDRQEHLHPTLDHVLNLNCTLSVRPGDAITSELP